MRALEIAESKEEESISEILSKSSYGECVC